jgi:Ni,Fe-hydrogenase maturation factor
LVPGRIRSRVIHPEKSRTASMTHRFSPEGLLADAWHLFHQCPEVIVISVGGASFEHGEGLSRQVEAVFPELLAQVRKSVQKCLAKADCRTPRRPGEPSKGGVTGKVVIHA